MTVGDNIKAFRSLYDLTQQQLADVLAVTRESVGKWESDKMAIRDRHVSRLVEKYGIQPEDIMSENYGLAASGSVESRALAIPGARPVLGVPTVKVPLVGRVHAGPAGDPDVYEDADESAEIPQTYIDIDPECVVVDFEGDCMINDFGDATSLIVSPNSPFGNGSIVIASIDGADYVVRRMEQTARELRLKASNPAYEDIVIPRDEEHEVDYKGKVLGCFRRFE